MSFKLLSGFLLVFVGLIGGNAVAGPLQALSFDGGLVWADGDKDTSGWRFQVTEDIVVSHLGAWDKDSDGFDSIVNVGLWKDDGDLIGSVEIPAGPMPLLIDETRYMELDAPIDLEAGLYYRIGAVAELGFVLHWMYDITSVVTLPSVVFDKGYYANVGNNEFVFPTEAYNSLAFFGPNFLVVPAPGGLLLVLLMLFGLLVQIRFNHASRLYL